MLREPAQPPATPYFSRHSLSFLRLGFFTCVSGRAKFLKREKEKKVEREESKQNRKSIALFSFDRLVPRGVCFFGCSLPSRGRVAFCLAIASANRRARERKRLGDKRNRSKRRKKTD